MFVVFASPPLPFPAPESHALSYINNPISTGLNSPSQYDYTAILTNNRLVTVINRISRLEFSR